MFAMEISRYTGKEVCFPPTDSMSFFFFDNHTEEVCHCEVGGSLMTENPL